MLLTTPVRVVLANQCAELFPAQRERRAPRHREREHRIQPRRIELRVLPLHEGRAGRQRDEVRDVARHAVQHQQRAVGIRAADVHVLAEDGELLGQVAVQLGQLAKARPVVDALLVPLLEGVRAAADAGDVQLVGAAHQRIADLRQLAQHLAAEWQTPVEISIMLDVISGTTAPGSGIFAISRSISSE
jgi:hypothetical protein